MRVSVRITRVLMLVAFGGLVVLAFLGFQAQDRGLSGLRQSSQELIFWDVAQGEVELQRFLAALARFTAGDPEVTAEEVNKRFDIVWSRVSVFRTGEIGRRLAEFTGEENVIDDLEALLARHEEAVVNISRPADPARYYEVLAEFAAAAERLRRLSVQVLAAEETRLAGVREHLRSSARITWALSMAALGLAALIVGILLVETRRYRRMAEEAAELAARAEAASQAKSRFLTMMSHELRTPMNGVLGLLALVRQTPLNERQRRLIERAERSGRQMSALLGDILDFSDLQSETLALEREMFELRRLGEAVGEMFGPVVQREGVAFRVEIAPDAPRWVVGDLGRLRQAVGHLVTFLVDMVGAREVCLRMGGREGMVEFAIEAALPEEGASGWEPEAMFTRGAGSYGEFASDSLGPMIARGLVTLMGGTVELARGGEGRALLVVRVPLETLDGPGGCVRVEADSVTVQLVLAALLRQLGVEVWDGGGERRDVRAVLLEAGGAEETARAARLRAEHPGAILVAIGEPANPGLFDAVCAQPVTAAALRTALAPVGLAAREVS